MAELKKDQLHRLARLGALARLEELRQEETAIRQAFPDLFRGRRRGAAASADAESAPTGRRRRRRRRQPTMSAAARKAVSDRMKRYWAERRKAKTK